MGLSMTMRRPVAASVPDETVLGPDHEATGVRAPSAEVRAWLEGFVECSALEPRRIAHAGIGRVHGPHRIRRACQTSNYFMATISGGVRVCIDGQWQRCGPGEACLLPAHLENAYEVEPGAAWEHAWICILEPAAQAATARLVRPLLAPWPTGSVRHAIAGLIESASSGQPIGLQAAWVELLHAQVTHFAGAGRVPDAFASLWDRVSERLYEPWPLERLAGEAHCSREQLRRLCQREFGRSPHNQVIQLRLRLAARLLASSDAKVESVADAVGYSNAFVFSLAFKKGMGCSPSEYRSRAH
jgi:AraC-like DNA-binding protein